MFMLIRPEYINILMYLFIRQISLQAHFSYLPTEVTPTTMTFKPFRLLNEADFIFC